MNLIFMGTPDFAVPALESLAALHNVVGVVSQPDRVRGRGNKKTPSPVKESALRLGLTVFQPEELDDSFFSQFIEPSGADAVIVAAYGKILPKRILDYPRYGCINIHASLLPKYRGAAPIHYAVLNGDEVTGVCTMLMSEGLDTGDVLLSSAVPLPEDATTGDMYEVLSKEGARLIVQTLDRLDEITPLKQQGEASYAHMIDKSTALIDWNKSSVEIYNLVRAMLPKPGAYSYNGGKMFKIHGGMLPSEELSSELRGSLHGKRNGQIIKICSVGLCVKCGGDEDFFCITRLQPENSKPMQCADYLRGNGFSDEYFG